MTYDPSKRQRIMSLDVRELSDDCRVWLHVDAAMTAIFMSHIGVTKITTLLQYTAILEWLIGYCEARAVSSDDAIAKLPDFYSKLSGVVADDVVSSIGDKLHTTHDVDISVQMKASDILRRALGEMQKLAEEYDRRRPTF